MGFFDRPDAKFIKLVEAIDERYRLYEILNTGDPDKIPKGLQTLLQEFRNLKIKAWDIEKGDNAIRLVKELHEDELKQQIDEEGDLR